MADPEVITCPLRATSAMVGYRDQRDADHWRIDHWSAPREHDHGTTWKWSWQPRTCSFCGGVHPEDAIRLLCEGWEDEIADGRRKGYLKPPGSIDRLNAFTNLTDKGVPPDEALERAPSVWSPVPPAKFYTAHFSPPQFEELQRVRCRRIPDAFKGYDDTGDRPI